MLLVYTSFAILLAIYEHYMYIYTVVERIVNKLVCIAQSLYIHIRQTIKLCIVNANEERVYSFKVGLVF